MPFFPVGYGEAFQPSDLGRLKCSRNHLRVYRAEDVKIVELDQPKRLARSM
jgi:hypothetical protein